MQLVLDTRVVRLGSSTLVPARVYSYVGWGAVGRDVVCDECRAKPEAAELYSGDRWLHASLEMHGEYLDEWDADGRRWGVLCDLCGEEVRP